MNSETRQAEILREAFDSCLRVIAGAAAGLEESIFAEWSRHAMKHAVAAGWNKVDAVDRLHQAGTAIGLDVFTIQEALTEAVRLAESNALPDANKANGSNGRQAGSNNKTDACCGALVSSRAADITPESVQWLWPGRLAIGKHTCVAGEPGTGKSQLSVAIIAAVTTGGDWPCGEGRAPLGNVIILSAEDGAADTIVPRLMAAGADLNRVHIVSGVLNDKSRRSFNLQSDIEMLEQKIFEVGDVVLIIIDPVSSYLGKTDSHKNSEVRGVLEPLSDMADRTRTAVLTITHFSKSGAGNTTKALHRFIGSIAFTGAPRAAFAVIDDAENEGRKLFLHAKNNLAAPPQGLAFRLEQRLIPGDILASNISWESEHVTASVDEALSASENRGGNESQSGKDEAADFLRSLLADGPIAVADIEAEARAAGLLGKESPIGQNKSFRDARKELGVVSSRNGFGPGARYVLSLPDGPWMPKNPMDAPLEKRASMTNQGIHDGERGSS